MCSYLPLIRTNLQISLVFLWQTEASSSASLPILRQKKVKWGTIVFAEILFAVSAVILIFCYVVAEDEQFEADKAQVVKEIAALEPKVGPWTSALVLVYQLRWLCCTSKSTRDRSFFDLSSLFFHFLCRVVNYLLIIPQYIIMYCWEIALQRVLFFEFIHIY